MISTPIHTEPESAASSVPLVRSKGRSKDRPSPFFEAAGAASVAREALRVAASEARRGRNTATLAHEVLRLGFEATVVCVDIERLDPAFAGRRYDESLLCDLPPEIDPCGENGEFHTFVSAGPMFEGEIPVRVGETVERDGFAYADLLEE